MILLYVGNNASKRSLASSAMIDVLKQKRVGAEHLHFDDISFSPSRFLETIDGMGLFEQKSVVILRYVLEDKAHRDLVLSKLDQLQSSDNAYIFIERSLHSAHIKKFEAVAHTVEKFPLPKKQEFNTFTLTDMLLKKDKKRLWLSYHEALRNNRSNEEIHGLFVWQLRVLLMTYTFGQKNSGLKPFVFNKSKRAQSVWSREKTEDSLFGLVNDYHLARRGEKLLPLIIEDFILSL